MKAKDLIKILETCDQDADLIIGFKYLDDTYITRSLPRKSVSMFVVFEKDIMKGDKFEKVVDVDIELI